VWSLQTLIPEAQGLRRITRTAAATPRCRTRHTAFCWRSVSAGWLSHRPGWRRRQSRRVRRDHAL